MLGQRITTNLERATESEKGQDGTFGVERLLSATCGNFAYGLGGLDVGEGAGAELSSHSVHSQHTAFNQSLLDQSNKNLIVDSSVNINNDQTQYVDGAFLNLMLMEEEGEDSGAEFSLNQEEEGRLGLKT